MPGSSTTTGSSRSSTAPRMSAGSQDGALFAPKFIENKLKFFPYIKEAVAFGDGRRFRRRLRQHRPRGGRQLGGAAQPRLRRATRSWPPTSWSTIWSQGCIEQVNRDLAAEPHLAGSQIRRFLILHKELDADDGELTRTRKVRRALHRRALSSRWSRRSIPAPTTGAHRDRGHLRGRPQGHDARRARDPRRRDRSAAGCAERLALKKAS